jgi:hypothetical protein
MNQYNQLILKLDAFIRKYYANKLLRGALVLLSCLLGYVLTVSISEYYFYLPVWLKVFIVTAFVLLGLAALLFWIIMPLAKIARLGKIISHEQAASIIGDYFPEVNDQLLNILQLKQQENTAASNQLIEASIGQKIKNIAVVPIGKAIDFSTNKKYLPFLLPLLLFSVFILIAAPNIFRDASQRLLQPTKTFERPAPFRFDIKSLPLQIVRNSDYAIRVSLIGNELPALVSIAIGNEQIPMQVEPQHNFQYTFKNVSEEISFRFYASGFYSQTYKLKVLQKPVVKGLKVHITYPSYTGRKNEDKNGISDMVLPVGANVSWTLSAEHTDKALLQFGEGNATDLPQLANVFGFQYRFMNDTTYSIILQNNESKVSEKFIYKVQIIPDQYPVLQVQEFKDTVSGKQIVINGTAGDDYGINKVLFQYQILDASNKLISSKAIPLKVSNGSLVSFQYYFDIESLGLQTGQKLNYFIEAWDNDGVHGSKASRSEMMSYKMYDAKQVDSALNKNAQQINSGLSNSAQKTEQLQHQMQEIQSKMLQSDQMDWQQKQSLQDLAKMQEQLKNNLDNVKKRFDEQLKQSAQKQHSDELKEKQEALKDQLDNLMNKELKEQMKKLQELLQKLNKEQSVEELQKMQEENKLFSMDMERMRELMKKLELQMRMEDMAAKMEQLAQKQSDLRKQTDEAKKDNPSLAKQQQQLKSELKDALQKDMKDMQELSKKIQQKEDISKEEKKGEQAEQDMQQSEQELNENKSSKSSQSQSKAAQNLQEMAKSLRQKGSGMDMEQIEMDIKAVRQILTNLMRLSFDQEQLITDVRATPANSSSYISNQEKQNSLHANSLLIRDSLFSLSKRLFKLAPTINKETVQLEKNMRYSLASLEARDIGDAASRQQYVMMHTNNLALMLNEILSNLMEQQSKAQKAGKQGQCNNPGGKTPKPGAGKQLSDIISKQKGLSESMQKSKEGQAKKGDDGKSKPGEGKGEGSQSKQNGGSDGNAEQLVRMAQQQAAIRRQLQELNSQLNSQGLGNAKEIKEIQDQMDKNESDLVNKKLDGTLLLRQKEILTRLMQAEQSLREQEQDDKRTSKNPDEISRPVPVELQKYLQENQQLLERYKTVPPTLKPYYKQLIENYYKQVHD